MLQPFPLHSDEPSKAFQRSNGIEHHADEDDDETEEMVAVQSPIQQSTLSATVNGTVDSAFKEPESINQVEVEEGVSKSDEKKIMQPSERGTRSCRGCHKSSTKILKLPRMASLHQRMKKSPWLAFDDPHTKEAAMTEEHSALPVDVTWEQRNRISLLSEESEAEMIAILLQYWLRMPLLLKLRMLILMKWMTVSR